MATDNDDIVRRLFDGALARRDASEAEALIAPDAVDHGPALLGLAGGPQGFVRATRELFDAMPDLAFMLDDVLATGDQVAAHWSATGTFTGSLRGIAATGKSASVTGTVIYRVADGKLVESWGNWDALGMFEQLDVLPLMAVHKRGLTG